MQHIPQYGRLPKAIFVQEQCLGSSNSLVLDVLVSRVDQFKIGELKFLLEVRIKTLVDVS